VFDRGWARIGDPIASPERIGPVGTLLNILMNGQIVERRTEFLDAVNVIRDKQARRRKERAEEPVSEHVSA
jgi:hypothetical protein